MGIIKCNKMLRASFAVLLLISSCHCLCEPLQSFADHVENDTSVQNQIDVLLPVCSDLTDEEALRHCERNINSYWSYFVSVDYAFYRNIYYATSAFWICDITDEDKCQECNQQVKAMSSLLIEENNIAQAINQVIQIKNSMFSSLLVSGAGRVFL